MRAVPNLRMNNATPRIYALLEDIPTINDALSNRNDTGVNPVAFQELAHELRQPLSAIESLAYYLELTAVDDQLCLRLEQIRSMVGRANVILDRAIES